MDEYRWIATSRAGFVQQVVCSYVRHGYYFFVSGRVPSGKSPELVDEKLIARYGIDRSRKERYRLKRAGRANIHYIRFENHWLMLATKGEHEWFSHERGSIRDVRRDAIHFMGYSIRLRRGLYRPHRLKVDRDGPPELDDKLRVRVQIGQKTYRSLRSELLELATVRSAEQVAAWFWSVPFEPYAPIRQQLLRLLCDVNTKRKKAGLSKVSPKVIRYRRRIVKPFEEGVVEHRESALC